MQLAYSLQQEQRMKLYMTPELKQSIHMLQLSALDLVSFLQEQSVDNPFIEIEWQSDSFLVSARRKKQPNGDRHEPMNPIENMVAAKATLESWMMEQFRMTAYDSDQYKAFAYLAGNLDEAGYLNVNMDEAGQALGLPNDVMESALRKLQSFDPPGIGGRNLQECLALQIAKDPHAVEGALAVVSGHLPDLAKGRVDKISKELDIDPYRVSEILDYIRELDPRPGLAFASRESQLIFVDAFVHIQRNQYTIEMNRQMDVKVRIHKENVDLLREAKNEQAARYYQEKMKAVDWLLRSLDQRNRTLFRVINAIVEEQFCFLDHTADGIKPLSLKILSEKLGIHESTVSRAVKDKYIRTPRGIFELKFFFSNGIQTSVGEDISAQNIKCMIKELINKENKLKPLSDQNIAGELKKHGIHISRRTVTKYREEELIVCSAMRKRIK